MPLDNSIRPIRSSLRYFMHMLNLLTNPIYSRTVSIIGQSLSNISRPGISSAIEHVIHNGKEIYIGAKRSKLGSIQAYYIIH